MPETTVTEWRVKTYPSGLAGTGWILERAIKERWVDAASGVAVTYDQAIAEAKAHRQSILNLQHPQITYLED